MKYHRVPNKKDRKVIKSLIKLCRKEQITIQANPGDLLIDGIRCVKVTPTSALIQGESQKDKCIEIKI